MKKRLAICLIALLIMTTCPGTYNRAMAASPMETLLFGAAAFAYINGQLNNLNDNHQADLLAQTEHQTGVYENKEANARIARIAKRLMANGLIKHHYAVYVTPDKDFNAFCTLGHVIAVNRGTLQLLDDDELAAVLGHEMSHGEHKDPVEGTKKLLGLSVLVDLYIQNNANMTSYVLSGAAQNYINNEVITMQEEWNADNSGFDNAVAAGYNPGGAAAAMCVLRAKLGELWHEGLSKIINPNNHPKTSDRIRNFAKRMTDYSNGHITVANDKTVQINGQTIVSPSKAFRYSAQERAYLIAGNLARIYHSNAIGKAYVGDGGSVYIGSQHIMTPAPNDPDAQQLAARINQVTGQ
jgi:predicted Zn-dependent protease